MSEIKCWTESDYVLTILSLQYSLGRLKSLVLSEVSDAISISRAQDIKHLEISIDNLKKELIAHKEKCIYCNTSEGTGGRSPSHLGFTSK